MWFHLPQVQKQEAVIYSNGGQKVVGDLWRILTGRELERNSGDLEIRCTVRWLHGYEQMEESGRLLP